MAQGLDQACICPSCQALVHWARSPQEPARLLPKRLLDLKMIPGNGNNLKLVITANMDPVTTRYATLSHCWGPPVVLPLVQTTQSLLHSFGHLIPFRSLPQNFKDAVSLTRMLNIRFL